MWELRRNKIFETHARSCSKNRGSVGGRYYPWFEFHCVSHTNSIPESTDSGMLFVTPRRSGLDSKLSRQKALVWPPPRVSRYCVRQAPAFDSRAKAKQLAFLGSQKGLRFFCDLHRDIPRTFQAVVSRIDAWIVAQEEMKRKMAAQALEKEWKDAA